MFKGYVNSKTKFIGVDRSNKCKTEKCHMNNLVDHKDFDISIENWSVS